MVENSTLAKRLVTLEIDVTSHVRVCSERQGAILARLNRIEVALLTAAGGSVLGLVRAAIEAPALPQP